MKNLRLFLWEFPLIALLLSGYFFLNFIVLPLWAAWDELVPPKD